MLLIHCDEATRKTFQEIGIDQTEIKLPTAEEVRVKHPVPQRGDLFLPIGSEEDTLGTVYGMPKQTKDYKKLEEFHNKVLRARVRMVTDHHVDRTRVFLLSYFLEDDTLQLFEEQQYNGGVVGGNFLKRGRYVNTLPGDSDAPRNFRHSDIYLGNVFCCSGCEFQIVEMDGISLTICESYPELFPLFDAFKVALRILPKVQALSQDLRAFLTQRAGTGRRGSQPQPARWMTRETLLLALEATGITRDLNDQELLTLIRRVKDTVEEKYFYQELCDLFVHLQFVSNIAEGKDGGRIRSALAGGRENNSEKEYFLRSLRGRKTQWRRTFRKDPRSFDSFVTMKTLLAVFKRNGVTITPQNNQLIVSLYQAAPRDAEAARQHLDQPVQFVNNTMRASLTNEKKQLFLQAAASRADLRSSARASRSELGSRAEGGTDSPTVIGSLPTPLPAPKINQAPLDIKTRRSNAMTSVMRATLPRATNGPEEPETNGAANDDEEELNINTVIDFYSLCDEIYANAAAK